MQDRVDFFFQAFDECLAEGDEPADALLAAAERYAYAFHYNDEDELIENAEPDSD